MQPLAGRTAHSLTTAYKNAFPTQVGFSSWIATDSEVQSSLERTQRTGLFTVTEILSAAHPNEPVYSAQAVRYPALRKSRTWTHKLLRTLAVEEMRKLHAHCETNPDAAAACSSIEVAALGKFNILQGLQCTCLF